MPEESENGKYRCRIIVNGESISTQFIHPTDQHVDIAANQQNVLFDESHESPEKLIEQAQRFAERRGIVLIALHSPDPAVLLAPR